MSISLFSTDKNNKVRICNEIIYCEASLPVIGQLFSSAIQCHGRLDLSQAVVKEKQHAHFHFVKQSITDKAAF